MSLGNFTGRQRRPLTERERAALQQQQQQNQRRYGNQPQWQNNWRRGNWGSGGGNWRQGNDYNRRNNRGNRNPSVVVKEDWTLLEDFEFNQFTVLSLPTVKEPVTWCALVS